MIQHPSIASILDWLSQKHQQFVIKLGPSDPELTGKRIKTMQIVMAMPQQQDQNKMTPLSDAISNYSTDIETGGKDVSNTKRGLVNGNRQRKQLWYVLGFVSVLVVAAIVVVAVLVAGGSGGLLTPQQQQLSEIAKSVSSQKDLQNSASPQYLAYNWLIDEDTFFNDADIMPRDLVVQRYILAVVYYATMGHQNWVNTTNWLQGSECLGNWFGISCNDQGNVRTLKFGKSSQKQILG
jgi:hypothetical protein